MKALELVRTISNLKASGKPTDDKSMSDFQWLFICNYYRAILIRQALQKGQSINEQCIQKLDSSKVTLTANLIDKKELTTNELPKFIEGHKYNLATYVGTEGGVSYQRTTYQKSQWDSYSKYIGKLPKWYELGNKITVVNHNKNLKLSIMGLFENPLEVIEFNDELDDMNPLDFEYPLANNMIDTIIKMIADSEIRLSMLVPKDELNDGRDGQ